MKHILSPANVDVLARWVGRRPLLAFDFDGTLAPIVRDPEGAAMRPATRRLLARLGRHFPTAVISGRSLGDVAARIDGLGVKYVVGNHGLEPAVGMARFERAARRIQGHLRQALASLVSVELEDKRYSLAIHYRKSAARREARRAILSAVAALPFPHRVVLGKAVVNVLPEGAPNKGTALVALRSREAAAAVFVGDDLTDEDVFQLDEPESILGIRVGRSASSAAAYFLRGQQEVDRLLELVLRLEPRSG